ncbi:hypothetical protein MMC14_010413 [Varicellaria rhodocarpa]|nr:hypothetical protein [Varicellaria rhodocarpa]
MTGLLDAAESSDNATSIDILEAEGAGFSPMVPQGGAISLQKLYLAKSMECICEAYWIMLGQRSQRHWDGDHKNFKLKNSLPGESSLTTPRDPTDVSSNTRFARTRDEESLIT